jgi:ABC-type nitrate/sulfonate/bicarbonate transport system substrate-binding protein
MRRRVTAVAVLCGLTLVLFGGSAASSTGRTKLTTINLDTLPIANGFPLDLGIQKGFFANHGIEIKKTTLQSGNDIVLALANGNGEIGYIGYVPAMIGRTQGIKFTVVQQATTRGRRSTTTGRTSWSGDRARSARRAISPGRPSPSTRSRAWAR